MLLIYGFTLNCNWQPVLLFQTWRGVGGGVVRAFFTLQVSISCQTSGVTDYTTFHLHKRLFSLFFCKHASLPINAPPAAAEQQSSLVVLPKGWSATFCRWSFKRFLDYSLACGHSQHALPFRFQPSAGQMLNGGLLFFLPSTPSSNQEMSFSNWTSNATEKSLLLLKESTDWKIQRFTAFIWFVGNPLKVADAKGLVSMMLQDAALNVRITWAALPGSVHGTFPHIVMQKCVCRHAPLCVCIEPSVFAPVTEHGDSDEFPLK